MDIESRFQYTARHGQLVTLQDGNIVATANHFWDVHPPIPNKPIPAARVLQCDICNARIFKTITRGGYAAKIIEPNEEYTSDYNMGEDGECENQYQICENCAAIIENYYNPDDDLDIKQPESESD